MHNIGLLTLGIFVGTLICVAVRKTTNWSDPAKVVIALIGAALSTTIFSVIQTQLGTSVGEAIFWYPVGLAWSLLWLYVDELAASFASKAPLRIFLGCVQLAGIFVGTVFVLILLWPTFRDVLSAPRGTSAARYSVGADPSGEKRRE